MAVRSHRTSQDRRRVSSEPHEVNYTGGKVAKGTGTTRSRGKRAVRKAKKQTGTVSRAPVERRAEKIAKRSGSTRGAARKRSGSSRGATRSRSRRGARAS